MPATPLVAAGPDVAERWSQLSATTSTLAPRSSSSSTDGLSFSPLSFAAGLGAGALLGLLAAYALSRLRAAMRARRHAQHRLTPTRFHVEPHHILPNPDRIVGADDHVLPLPANPFASPAPSPMSSTFSLDSSGLPLPRAVRDAHGRFTSLESPPATAFQFAHHSLARSASASTLGTSAHGHVHPLAQGYPPSPSASTVTFGGAASVSSHTTTGTSSTRRYDEKRPPRPTRRPTGPAEAGPPPREPTPPPYGGPGGAGPSAGRV